MNQTNNAVRFEVLELTQFILIDYVVSAIKWKRDILRIKHGSANKLRFSTLESWHDNIQKIQIIDEGCLESKKS